MEEKKTYNSIEDDSIEIVSDIDYNAKEKTIFDDVQCPEYYSDSKIKPIDYIEDKNLGFCLGNVIKYVSRAGKKHSAGKSDREKAIEDLKKARWYLDRRIKELEDNLCD